MLITKLKGALNDSENFLLEQWRFLLDRFLRKREAACPEVAGVIAPSMNYLSYTLSDPTVVL